MTDLPLPRADQPNVYEDADFSLYDLHRALVRAGALENLTFIRCRIDGPSVLLMQGGVAFERCDMGGAHGDVRNLLLRPVGEDRVTGAIPILNCRFVECRFTRIGFTGDDAFLENFTTSVGGSAQP